ncbi:hypothetical protein [Nocardia miyunensis]|uniref:hypothetical protein n=1 Tax=Nocardia miyunensis TaxID=282684 RepID=UPI000833C9FB
MAITQVAVYAHPSAADIEALGRDLDEIRQDIEDQLGTRDANYIRRTIAFQRALDATARLTIAVSRGRLAVSGAEWSTLAAYVDGERKFHGHNTIHADEADRSPQRRGLRAALHVVAATRREHRS